MAVVLQPFGVKCNIQCQYCYQNPQRDAGNVLHSYDLEKMKAAVEAEDGPFTLFGGEPLLMPEKDLEDIFAWGYRRYGENRIQTNGTLINENHIRMFKRFKVVVGISIDGPGELNDARWAGSLQRTREATARASAAIERLCQEQWPPGLIVTLHRCNATEEKLPIMHDWVVYLESIGVRTVGLHILEVENELIRRKYALSNDENIKAFLSFYSLEKRLTRLRFDVFKHMRDLLLGQDGRISCIWSGCDPYTTRSVQGVEGNGRRNNCGRTNKDGVDFMKANTEGFERPLALYHVPQEYGGCEGYRFFLMCKGQCPGTAIGGDWRNRSEHCEVWKELYQEIEEEMLGTGMRPLSVRPERTVLERIVLNSWAVGRNPGIADVLRQLGEGGLQETESEVLSSS